MFESNDESKKFKFSDYPILKIEKNDFKNSKLLKRFLEIPDCPKQIYYRGNISQFENFTDMRFLSVVGSRTITNYGKDSIEKIISPLSNNPICIISGLAIGVDGISHKQALKARLPIIAIPGSGLGEKTIYPKLNRDLALEILNHGGVLISEYEENFGSAIYTFPARNRLMAALSDAVLLIEAAEKSGTMITARLATEYNKDVWCIPGSIFSDNSFGTNELIKNGAALISSHKDILHNFRITIPEEMEMKNNFKIDLVGDEEKVYTNIVEEINKEKLMENCGLEFSDFFTALTMLEMKNLIKIDSGIVRKI